MYKYIVKRVLMMIPVLLGITILVFLMLRLTPGDPARSMLGDTATQEEVEALREELGLNDNLVVQYVRYMGDLIFHGSLGTSYVSGREVMTEILDRFPTTILLTLCGITVTILIGVPTGIIAAVKQNSWMDKVATFIGLFGVSMPAFWLGLLLAQFFSLRLGWLPATGFYGPKYWILPAITVGLNTSALVMRMTRSTMLEVIRQDYIRTARAKGVKERRVVMKHALDNCLIPLITVIGLQIGSQLGGAMVTETIFSIPGLGKYLVDSITSRDYPVIQGGVLFTSIVFCVVNLFVDILYAYADPRIKTQYVKSGGKKRTAEKVKEA
ncbi:MAG: ABC transporter permease [Lachnospiraceae bacterium]|nr:ABC transporter permease [Lachnospiraceae bacterium]